MSRRVVVVSGFDWGGQSGRWPPLVREWGNCDVHMTKIDNFSRKDTTERLCCRVCSSLRVGGGLGSCAITRFCLGEEFCRTRFPSLDCGIGRRQRQLKRSWPFATAAPDQDKLIYLARRKKSSNMQQIGQVLSIPGYVLIAHPAIKRFHASSHRLVSLEWIPSPASCQTPNFETSSQAISRNGKPSTGATSASAKDAIRDPRETNSSVASRLPTRGLGSQKRFPWSLGLSWRRVTQRFSAHGPMARGHPQLQLHRQDSVEPGAAGVHLFYRPSQGIPTAFTSRCRLRKGSLGVYSGFGGAIELFVWREMRWPQRLR